MRPLLGPVGALVLALALALPAAALALATRVAAVGTFGNGARFLPEQIEQGRTQYHRTCAQCHGRNRVNAGTTVFDLRKFPVNEADRFQNSVAHGKGSMPSSFIQGRTVARADRAAVGLRREPWRRGKLRSRPGHWPLPCCCGARRPRRCR